MLTLLYLALVKTGREVCVCFERLSEKGFSDLESALPVTGLQDIVSIPG